MPADVSGSQVIGIFADSQPHAWTSFTGTRPPAGGPH